MSTTVKVGKSETTIKSDDIALEERLARYAIELTAGRQLLVGGADWQLPKFITRCGRHQSQIGLLRQLVEKGRMTRSEMVKAAGKSSGRELAGCRGSMSKNALASKLPSDWWKDSWDQKSGERITELRSDVREDLKRLPL